MTSTRFAYVVVSAITWMFPSGFVMAQQTVSGRIVMYNWTLHELTNNDDFILKTHIRSKEEPQFVRVIYRVNWGFDAPESSVGNRLDRLAFIGRGASWEVLLRAPETEDQKRACAAPIIPHRYQDEEGAGILPRYVPTPGGKMLDERTISKMPCRILLGRENMQRSK